MKVIKEIKIINLFVKKVNIQNNKMIMNIIKKKQVINIKKNKKCQQKK